MPATRLKSVLLPEPDGPTIDTNSPESTCNETSCSTSSGARGGRETLRDAFDAKDAVAHGARALPGSTRSFVKQVPGRMPCDHLVARVLDDALPDHPTGVGLPLLASWLPQRPRLSTKTGASIAVERSTSSGSGKVPFGTAFSNLVAASAGCCGGVLVAATGRV